MCLPTQFDLSMSACRRSPSFVRTAFSQPLPCCLRSLSLSPKSLQCPRLTRIKCSPPSRHIKRVRMVASSSQPEGDKSEGDKSEGGESEGDKSEGDKSEGNPEQLIEASSQEQQQPQAEEPRQDEVEEEDEEDASYEDYEALLEENEKPLWDTLDVSKALQPLTEEEKKRLRTKLPKQLANFLIRRADAAVRLRNTKPGDSSFLGRFLGDLPPDKIEWDDPANAEFRDYVYETTTGPPSYRQKGSSLFGGGDGLPDMEDLPDVEDAVEPSNGLRFPKKVMSMFVGNVGGVDEQAAKVGYTLLALFVLLISAKILFAFISFFLSFTFSFLAIFALSAGIFVVFYLFRF